MYESPKNAENVKNSKTYSFLEVLCVVKLCPNKNLRNSIKVTQGRDEKHRLLKNKYDFPYSLFNNLYQIRLSHFYTYKLSSLHAKY